ncbi:LysR family transcriptional regulator [Paenibacillus filicis]|uniref:LysR family transcriptional regulator n=1 Tax=Paenibacillus gyeongsangnamensis TaxID=3388067 RepID=A0ABT4QFG7_9BACL|nr:LysR family transcriptional regulator [Paenibacillus filicis]MCZ8515618.1 LysR family transcriptional regulator [Paenibacillus filicis]
MDLRNLTYILEVARQQNFTKAADILHLTQPTLSKLVKSMEDELGVTLFDRSGKTIKLTDAGAAAVQQIHHILKSVNDLYTTLDDVSELKTGSIKIGLPPVVSTVFFPRIIAPFQRKYPNIDFDMVEEGAKKIEQLVLGGSIDVGVVLSPDEDSSLGRLPFLQQRLSLLLHKTHPLSDRASVSLTELSKEPFLLFAKGFAVRQHVLEACHSSGFHPPIAYESSQWDLLVEMVAAGMGVSFLPEPICSKVTSPDVSIVPSTTPQIPWYLYVIWNNERYVSYALRELLAFIRTASRLETGK